MEPNAGGPFAFHPIAYRRGVSPSRRDGEGGYPRRQCVGLPDTCPLPCRAVRRGRHRRGDVAHEHCGEPGKAACRGAEALCRALAEVGRLRAEPADPAGDARGSGTGILSRGRSGRSREPDQAVCDGARHTADDPALPRRRRALGRGGGLFPWRIDGAQRSLPDRPRPRRRPDKRHPVRHARRCFRVLPDRGGVRPPGEAARASSWRWQHAQASSPFSHPARAARFWPCPPCCCCSYRASGGIRG